MPFVREVDDGYDTIDWMVGRERSDRRVGMFGDSCYGAARGPPPPLGAQP